MRLTFWGVRGSTPTPRSDRLGYGGNTACLEVRFGHKDFLVFDAGTGLRNLGIALAQEYAGEQLQVNLFLTHYHWDHIQGIPFFAPLYGPDNEVSFHAHRFSVGLADLMHQQMMEPFFPVEFSHLPAKKSLHEIDRTPVQMGAALVRPFPLYHPQGCMGYRIEHEGKSIVYASDFEHGEPEHDAILLEYATGADILVYDAMYDVEEYEDCRKGWGHSTWLEAVRLAARAGVGRLVLFHHNPAYSDERLSLLEARARAEFDATEFAREGSTLEV